MKAEWIELWIQQRFYFIEDKTSALVKAKLINQEIRQIGGIMRALKFGWIQDRIDKVKAAMPEKVLGVNCYPNDAEKLPVGMTIAPTLEVESSTKERFADRDIEPLRVVRWSESLEFQFSTGFMLNT